MLITPQTLTMNYRKDTNTLCSDHNLETLTAQDLSCQIQNLPIYSKTEDGN
jgi:hypothetical protein